MFRSVDQRTFSRSDHCHLREANVVANAETDASKLCMNKERVGMMQDCIVPVSKYVKCDPPLSVLLSYRGE